jgi:hypothetical protein
LFGGLWGTETVKEVLGEEDLPPEEEPTMAELAGVEAQKVQGDEEEEDDTLKGEKAAGSTATPASLSGLTGGGGGRARLSAIFSDWIAPDAAAAASSSSAVLPASQPRARVVGQPVAMSKAMSRRFSSFTPGDRLSVIHSAGSFMEQDEEDEAEGEEEDLEASLEQLMVRRSHFSLATVADPSLLLRTTSE